MKTDDDPYRDPALYDLEYDDYTEDIAYYRRLALATGSPILELGAGTGRLMVPLLRAGLQVDGVERSPGMLEGLRAKLEQLHPPQRGRARIFEGDFRTLPEGLHEQYALVMWPFNALHHCADGKEVAQTLLGAARRLRPEGRIALDVYLPDRELYDRDPEQTYEHRIFRDPRTGASIHTWEQGWWDEARRIHHVIYTYRYPDGRERRTHLALRMFERHELEAIFQRCGLRVLHSAEDFEGNPLRPGSLKWVVQLGA